MSSISMVESAKKIIDITEKLYDLYGSDQESTTSCNYQETAQFLGVGDSIVTATLKHLRSLGLFSNRYGPGPIGEDGKHHGRASYWTFHGPKETALSVLKKHLEQRTSAYKNHQSELMRARRAAEHSPKPEPVTTVIVGPEPENPFKTLQPLRKADDAEALIEAGRQYAARMDFMEKKLKELKDAGIEVDRSAVHVETDEELEVISKILPVINALENKIKQATEQITSLKEKTTTFNKLDSENRKLKLQVERMVAERVNGS